MVTRKMTRIDSGKKDSLLEQKSSDVEDTLRDQQESDACTRADTNTVVKDDLGVNTEVEKDTNVGENMDSDDQVEKYISDNVLTSECETCGEVNSKAVDMLDDLIDSKMMIQVLWSNLTNNFTYKFIPRLLSKPYSSEGACPKFEKIVKSLILRNIEKENKRLGWSVEVGGDEEAPRRSCILPCQHPEIYSTSIQNLTPVGSEETGIALIDELGKILHSKELIPCLRFLNKSPFQVGNLYKHELKSLVWGVNGTIYHAGDEPETELLVPETAYFNIKYQHPELYLPLANTPLTIVREPDDLRRMIADILNSMDSFYERNKASGDSSPFLLAIDVEHHSVQSYKGFVSLIQLSTRNHDYIVDPFNIFNEIQSLNELTANPKILKILHGSDYDVIWLQRDFSVYIVNMFDTGQAARVLNTPGGFSLKNLLSTYCSLDIDKSLQLADWRERPLKSQLIQYARGDTHYLLYIYDIMKNLLLLLVHKKATSSILVSDAFLEVENSSIILSEDLLERFDFGDSELSDGRRKLVKISDFNPSALLTVLHNSRQICLKEYFEKPLDIWSLCYKVRTRLPRSCCKNPTDYAAATLLGYYLSIWRDFFARALDVSTSYFFKESTIFKICQKRPISKENVVLLCQNAPSNVSKSSEHITEIVTCVNDFIASKSEDEIFDFNSQISHIYSIISNSTTSPSDPDKYKVKKNHRVVSNDACTTHATSCLGPNNSVEKSHNVVEETESAANELPSSHQDAKQQTPEASSSKRRFIAIKRSPQDSSDRFADNLFGSPFKDYQTSSDILDINNSTPESNKRRISNEIIQDINNTLNGEVPQAFKHKKHESFSGGINNASSTPTSQANTDSFPPEKTKTTFEDYYSAKTNDDDSTLNNEAFTPLVSVKDIFNECGDYLHVKQKQKKTAKSKRTQESSLTGTNTVHPAEKQKVNSPNLSRIVRENADILPASISCTAVLPDFIKNNQSMGSTPNKPKKFVESMKTKKWHKKR